MDADRPQRLNISAGVVDVQHPSHIADDAAAEAYVALYNSVWVNLSGMTLSAQDADRLKVLIDGRVTA